MESKVIFSPYGGVTYLGPDAQRLFQAKILAGSLDLYQSHRLLPTRGVNLTRLLALASTFSHRKYKRTEVPIAIADLKAWVLAMQCAIPVEQEAKLDGRNPE